MDHPTTPLAPANPSQGYPELSQGEPPLKPGPLAASLGAMTQPAPDVLPTRDVLLSARGVTKTYTTGANAVTALRGVDLDVRAGDLMTVMGPSGNGKTTLLNCLSGIDSIDAGEVFIDGEDIHAMRDAKRTQHRAERMGFIFQSFNLIPVLSARENVEIPLGILGVAPSESRGRAEAMLERVGLAGSSGHRPRELSGGEQQRVAIARALVTEPAIVWGDEPTGNLDSETAASIVDMLREINANGQTVVMVTHDRTIASIGNRTVLVRDGRITFDGAPGDIDSEQR